MFHPYQLSVDGDSVDTAVLTPFRSMEHGHGSVKTLVTILVPASQRSEGFLQRAALPIVAALALVLGKMSC